MEIKGKIKGLLSFLTKKGEKNGANSKKQKIFLATVKEKIPTLTLCSFNKKTGQKSETNNRNKGVFRNQKLHSIFAEKTQKEKWAKMHKNKGNFLVKRDFDGKYNLLFDFSEKNKCQNDDFARKGEKVKTPKRRQRADFDL